MAAIGIHPLEDREIENTACLYLARYNDSLVLNEDLCHFPLLSGLSNQSHFFYTISALMDIRENKVLKQFFSKS